MKKIFLLALAVFLIGLIICVTSKNNDEYKYLEEYFNEDEIDFMKENEITYNDINLYLTYDNFDVLKYYDYEKVRSDDYSHLEAINIVNNPNYYQSYINTKKALFLNTSYVLVNKHYYLLSTDIPSSLAKLEDYNLNFVKRENETMMANVTALENLEALFLEASLNNLNLLIYSSYRDYEKQEYLYYVVNLENDDYSARPGHSEHQTGLAFDISTTKHGLTTDFANSMEFDWLFKNSYNYGFILRYPETKESITLYKYEPWHFRYVGKTIAKYIYDNDLTLEEYIIKNYPI